MDHGERLREETRRSLKRIFKSLGFDVEKCWVLPTSTNSAGYTRVHVANKNLHAHKYMYELFFGKVKKGLVVMHLCHNKLCCNPFHLQAGTYSENMKAWSETRCKK